jgi:hypothetical protein
LRHGERLLAEVGHPLPAALGGTRRLSPSQLRQAVAAAWMEELAELQTPE